MLFQTLEHRRGLGDNRCFAHARDLPPKCQVVARGLDVFWRQRGALPQIGVWAVHTGIFFTELPSWLAEMTGVCRGELTSQRRECGKHDGDGPSEVLKGAGGFFILISMLLCVGDGGFHRHTSGKHDGRGSSEVLKGAGGFFILISMFCCVSDGGFHRRTSGINGFVIVWRRPTAREWGAREQLHGLQELQNDHFECAIDFGAPRGVRIVSFLCLIGECRVAPAWEMVNSLLFCRRGEGG